ncbi:Gfo/Idh/MocA family oxidoreductase [Paracoccus marcusii]|nr:Gfo/Idh/MocA family oxidoreductase [Paracoccus marcusii]
MDRIRLGFIGAGGIAHRHFGVLQTMPDVQVVAICDTDPARAQEAADRMGPRPITITTRCWPRMIWTPSTSACRPLRMGRPNGPASRGACRSLSKSRSPWTSIWPSGSRQRSSRPG